MGAPATAGTVGYTYNARMWVAKRDNDGYAMGTASDPNSPSNDTVYGAYVLQTVVDVTPGENVQPKIEFVGSQVRLASTFLPNVQPGDITVNLNMMDETFNALIENSLVDTTTNTAATITADNSRLSGRPKFLVGFNLSVTNKDTGADEWVTLVYPNCAIKKQTDASTAIQTGDAVNPSNITYIITPSLSSRAPDGQLISAYALGVSGDETYFIRYRTAYPLHLATWIADGTEDDFDLPYLPINSDATGAGQNMISKNGTESTVTSVSTTTGNVVIAAAGSDGDIWQVLYQVNDYETA